MRSELLRIQSDGSSENITYKQKQFKATLEEMHKTTQNVITMKWLWISIGRSVLLRPEYIYSLFIPFHSK